MGVTHFNGLSSDTTLSVGTTSTFTGVATFTAAPVFNGGATLNDDDLLTLGSSADVTIEWDTAATPDQLQIVPAADDTVFSFGKSAATQLAFDLKWIANEANAASYLYADASANLIYTTGVDLQFLDNDFLVFGTGSGATGDVTIAWDATDLDMVATAASAGFNIGATGHVLNTTLTGTLTVGVDDTGHDVKLFGATAGAYLLWDESADALLGVGKATMQIGESTVGVTAAGGTSMIYGYGAQKTTALTGSLRGVRGNAAVLVASVDGTAEGMFGRASNGLSTSSTDGVNLDTARGGSFLVAGAGKAAAGPSVLEKAHGLYAQLDIDAPNLTVSDARGLYINVQSGNDTANTLTACNLAYLEYESVVGTAPAINSAIKIAGVGGYTAATCLIDASTFQTAVHDTDQVTLFKFKNSAGAVITCSYDTGTPSFVFA